MKNFQTKKKNVSIFFTKKLNNFKTKIENKILRIMLILLKIQKRLIKKKIWKNFEKKFFFFKIYKNIYNILLSFLIVVHVSIVIYQVRF